jgi:hypothetical protein
MSDKARCLAALVLTAFMGLALVACSDVGDGMMGSNGSRGMGPGGGMMGGSVPSGAITVQLVDWSVVPSQSSAKAGAVTFHVVHGMMDMMRSGSEGGTTHDLQVMRKNTDGNFELVGQVQGLRVGEAKDLTLDLLPGQYELSCNVTEELDGKVVSHYLKGMHTPFVVS